MDTAGRQARITTGIRGLDRILHGGLIAGGLHLVQGATGTGKTILANQICFQHVSAGGRALFTTLLSETHARLLSYLAPFAFYREEPIGTDLAYLGVLGILEDGGLDGLLDLLRREMRRRSTTVLVVDGLSVIERAAPSDLLMQRFLQELQVTLDGVGCTGLLLARTAGVADQPAYAMADAVLELHYDRVDLQPVRWLDVRKYRGGPALDGQHSFTIDTGGIAVFPRCEAVAAPAARAVPDAAWPATLPFGISGLDAMLGGGLTGGSRTLLLGATGAGKTLLGLHWLAAGAAAGEPGLSYSFSERPSEVLRWSATAGLELAAAVEAGRLDLIRVAPLETLADALADQLLDAVHRHGARRVLIDGLNGFVTATLAPQRLHRFLVGLFELLHAAGASVIFTLEAPAYFDPIVGEPLEGISALAETIILLRAVEERGHLRRLISLRKVRDRAHELGTHAFDIGARGITVDADTARAEAILAHLAGQVTSPSRPA